MSDLRQKKLAQARWVLIVSFVPCAVLAVHGVWMAFGWLGAAAAYLVTKAGIADQDESEADEGGQSVDGPKEGDIVIWQGRKHRLTR
jgi:hypothetical protein